MFLLRLLGGVSVGGPDGPLHGRVAQRRQLALLAVLGGRTAGISRDRIAALLWPDCSDERGRALLSDALHVVRRALGTDAIRTTGQDLSLDPDIVRCDVRCFQDFLAAGDRVAALDLYIGPFLDGFHLHATSELERWADAERARLSTLAVEAALAVAQTHDSGGRLQDAASWARRALAIDPYHEVAARDLCRLLVRSGDRAGAVRALAAFAARLRDDLGVEPAPATLAVVDAAGATNAPAEPRAAAAVAASSTFAAAAARRRLAVLPFTDLLNDASREYFVLGMHDGVIAELAQARVPVIARTSVMCYAQGATPVREIGRTLCVQLVLEGSVLRVGQGVRVRTRLIDTASEEHIWAAEYGLDDDDPFGSHQRITHAIARAVRGSIEANAPSDARVRVDSDTAVDERAYESYLRGRFHYFRFTPQDMAAALRCFELALEYQPALARPHAGIANVRTALGVLGALPPDEAMPHARTAALRALQLDPTLSEASHALACVLAWYDFDFAAADAEFQHAVALNPSNADAHAFHGHLLTVLGRTQEGEEALERAIELDPLNPFLRALRAVQLTLVARYDDAIATARAALETAGDLMLAHMCLWGTCNRVGRHDDALQAIRTLYALQHDDAVVLALQNGASTGERAASTYADSVHTTAGAQASSLDDYRARMRAAADVLAERAASRFVRPFLIAVLYDHAGDIDRACQWLDTAYRTHDHDSVYLGGLPHSDALRADRRYVRLLRRMGLPDLRELNH